ncbi:MAG TPA: type VI secretion system tube protein Hcp [Acetobacteraceae bacterium]|nr:type VI secretion system tube protein Hcp [Acetobacteraceae bacterium]
MAIYMKYGGTIKGSVTTDGFKDWIELGSFQWGVGRSVTSPSKSSDTREGSEPSISEIVVTKRMDKASPKLWQDAVGGDFSTAVEIHFTTTTKDKVETYLQYNLTETGLSGYSASAGGEDAPQETVSLNFATVTWKYTGRDSKIAGTPDVVGWDLTQQKKI